MPFNIGKPLVQPKLFSKAPPLTESIYDLIPPEEDKPEKPPRYKSVYNESIRNFYESQKVPHKTMGYYRFPLPDPEKYLKKRTRDHKFFDDATRKYRELTQPKIFPEKELEEKQTKKPPVPRHSERPIMPNTNSATKDFIKENIRDVSRKVPKKPEPKLVDSQKGNSILLEFSGLVPKFCTKKEYGVTPKYLVMRQKDMDYSRQKYEEFVKEQIEKETPKQITDEERDELIAKLKKNWEEALHDYLCLPMVIETFGRKRMKERVEERLKTLERDINLLQKHKHIYVLE